MHYFPFSFPPRPPQVGTLMTASCPAGHRLAPHSSSSSSTSHTREAVFLCSDEDVWSPLPPPPRVRISQLRCLQVPHKFVISNFDCTKICRIHNNTFPRNLCSSRNLPPRKKAISSRLCRSLTFLPSPPPPISLFLWGRWEGWEGGRGKS